MGVLLVEEKLALVAPAHKERPQMVKGHMATDLRIVSAAVQPAVAEACLLGVRTELHREQGHSD